MMYKTGNRLGESDCNSQISRRSFLVGGGMVGLAALLRTPSDAYAQSPPSHMGHVKALEVESNEGRAAYVTKHLKSRGLEHVVEEYRMYGTEGVNIIFETGSGEKAVVFTAHYDTVPGSPGANDDASCVAVILNAYEQLLKENLRNIKARFIIFGDEEKDRTGSRAYARAHDLSNIAGVYSLELCGIGDTLFAWDVVSDKTKNSQIMKVLEKVAKSNGIELRVRGIVRVGGDQENYSDHRSFESMGIPGFGLTILPGENPRAPFEHYHQSSDTSDTLQPEAMKRMSEIVYGIVREFNK